MIVKFKKLHDAAIIPQYQSAGASGFDLHSIEDVTLHGFTQTTLVKTGLAVEMSNPINMGGNSFEFEMQVRPRSGLSIKSGLIIVNSPGTIDRDYRGEIKVPMRYIPYLSVFDDFYSIYRKTYEIKAGDRIAQAVVCPVFRCHILESEELSETKRGQGGFGHTGR